jgi:transposase
MEYIAFDSHKHYTLASVARPNGQLVREQRLPHERGALQQFLARCEPGSPVAVETIGNWYWIVDEIEAAGCIPKLVHARKAKLMIGEINKTDKLDVRGLNQLQRNGTLPTVWIPPGELRDQRDLPRTRMVLVRQRTQLKNRIHATLAKYALHDLEISDLFGTRGRALLRQRLELLPPCTAYATQQLLEQVENLDRQVRGFEHQIQTVFKPAPAIQLLLTLPGSGSRSPSSSRSRWATSGGSPPPRSSPPTRARHRASTPAAARPASDRPAPTSIATSSGRSSKRQTPSASIAAARRAVTSVASTSASPGAKATRKLSAPSPDIWPKRRTGSSRNKSPIGNRRPRPFRRRGISADNP